MPDLVEPWFFAEDMQPRFRVLRSPDPLVSPSCAPTRGSSRFCASRPAFCTRFTSSSCRTASSPRRTSRALALEEARREGKRIPRRSPRPQLLLYSNHVRYAVQLRRYREVFATEQLLVLVYHDFQSGNEATVRSVLEFLDVGASPSVEVTRENVTSTRTRSQRLDDLLNTLSVAEARRRVSRRRSSRA